MCFSFAILTALVEEPTKMVIMEHRAGDFSASSAHMQAAMQQTRTASAEVSFESMSATSMSTMMAESLVTMSSSSTMMEMSTHSHVEASSSARALTTEVKGEMYRSYQ